MYRLFAFDGENLPDLNLRECSKEGAANQITILKKIGYKKFSVHLSYEEGSNNEQNRADLDEISKDL